ncbi:class I adenylate-forming enzyme family protein [Nocardioides sp. zg-DK7169]|uniref:class I adenylate-forming enzyme family protein n=1 Tax=Nocardioides sp. zg-DK7169 TaxID=2736600 RepID=UPI001554B410|nr:class I adenylate-forming enzyme family protein [Nocardioides sp. zg-DK7169]NPC96709.1 acyl--CoA ligase [Nocardioides sp. zg-DK7169]
MSATGGARTLGELCELRAETHPDAVAVRDDTTSLTYAGLASRARAVARFLGERGVVPGDRVVVQGPNRTAWVSAAYGVLLAGATVAPLGHRVAVVERVRLLDRIAPRLVLQDESVAPVPGAVGFAELGALPAEPPGAGVRDRPSGGPEAPALVLCSSGTSGALKAVPMTHAQLLRVYDHVARVLDARGDDVWLATVPLAHSFGFNGILLVAMMTGATVRLLPGYDPARLTRLLREERVTVLAGPPTIYHDLAGLDPDAPARHTRLGIVGSTEVSAPDMARLATRLGIPRMATGYGMTETCGTVALGEVPREPDGPLAWMTPLPDCEVRISDEAGRAVPAGARGRVQVRGYHVCRADIGAPAVSPEEWFDTGDLGELDAAGRLAVAGRANDTIIVSGFNVDPREVEAALREHPQVADVAVVGVHDPRVGQRLLACVIPAGDAPDTAELAAHGRARLTPYKVPGEYVVLDELPRTATGKLSRAALRRMVEDGPATAGRD